MPITRMLLASLVALSAGFPTVGAARPVFTVVHSFTGLGDGSVPAGRLVRNAAGTLFGTTAYGGAFGAGAVFQITAAGVESIVHSFHGGTEANHPVGGLVLMPDGALVGATMAGGRQGLGTAFRTDPNGRTHILHSFGSGADPSNPVGTPARDTDGNFYGMGAGGGGSSNGGIYYLDHDGAEGLLASFDVFDYGSPDGALLRDRLGTLYGVASIGGPYILSGAVFSVTADGTLTVLHYFGNGSDGVRPMGDLARDTAGNFYGTTYYGGTFYSGTVYRLSAEGGETILYDFTGGGDGGAPASGVVVDRAGRIFGTTTLGGADNKGVVFELVPGAGEVVLHDFTGGADGGAPVGSLVVGPNGHLFGVASQGGAAGNGTVFDIKP